MVPINKVKDIINKFDVLEKELSLGKIDPKLFVKKSKDYSSLQGIIKIARKYVNFESERKDIINLIQGKSNDTDIVELAQQDVNELSKDNEK